MEPSYIRDRHKREKIAKAGGALLTVGIHVLACLCLVFTGVKYIYPPPPESTFLLEFDEADVEKIIQQYNGREPQAEEIDISKPIELIQKSESPYTATKTNTTPATKPDDFGDVDVPTPKQEPKLDPRASFPGMSKKDTTTTAPHSATEAGSTFKAGQPSGNTNVGKTDGQANAHLKGRSLLGNIAKPTYDVQKDGVVVVTIWVDQYGTVTKAQAGAPGTTVNDATLWAAARSAAMKTHFNQSADAPALQEGTITYIFSLK